MKQDLKMKRGERERKREKRGEGRERGEGRRRGRKTGERQGSPKIFEVALKIRRTHRCSREVRDIYARVETHTRERMRKRGALGGARGRERDGESERKAVVARGPRSARENSWSGSCLRAV